MACKRRTPKNPCYKCRFNANFTYNEASCLLTFTLVQACQTPIDSTLVVVITGPDGVDTSLQTVEGNTLTWIKYKPADGVWTAVGTLSCPEGSTFERTITYTTDEEAAFDCNCCDLREPDYIVISNLGGCCDHANGTFDLSIPITNDTYNCGAETPDLILVAPPANKLVGYCFQIVHGGQTYNFFKQGVLISVSISDLPPYNPPLISVTFNVRFYVYRVSDTFNGTATSTYAYIGGCESGILTPTLPFAFYDGRVRWAQDSSGTSLYYPCSGTPIAELYLADL